MEILGFKTLDGAVFRLTWISGAYGGLKVGVVNLIFFILFSKDTLGGFILRGLVFEISKAFLGIIYDTLVKSFFGLNFLVLLEVSWGSF